MENNSNLSTRFVKALDLLGVSAYRAAKELGTSDSVLSKIKQGRTPNAELLESMVSIYGVNPEWILSGTGPFKKEDQKTSVDPKVQYGNPNVLPIVVDEHNKERIPLVRSKASAGYIGKFMEPEFVSNLPTYSIPGMTNATFRMFEITGHSMRPTIEAGDIVVASYVERITEIRNDRIHVIVTNNDIMIKRAIVRMEEEKIICKSDNAEQGYPPIVLDFEDVREIWYVKMNMTRQFPNPTDLHQRIANLEGDVAILNDLLNKNQKK